ncbi:MAG: metal-dependent hydrolase [Deltaproteobacteria bacterium]|nr:metal-dependent hydrolase [Deltaproteobacteria bacterium]
MASPLGHALAGVAVGALVRGERPLWGRWLDWCAFAGLAVLPDLDFLPGLLMGDLNRYHHGVSHTLAAALVVGLGLALAGRSRGQALRWGLAGFAILASHLALDWLAVDNRPPLGIPLFWPLSGAYHQAAHPVFLDMKREAFTWAVIGHDLKAAAWELCLLGPPTLLILWFTGRAKRPHPESSEA